MFSGMDGVWSGICATSRGQDWLFSFMWCVNLCRSHCPLSDHAGNSEGDIVLKAKLFSYTHRSRCENCGKIFSAIDFEALGQSYIIVMAVVTCTCIKNS